MTPSSWRYTPPKLIVFLTTPGVIPLAHDSATLTGRVANAATAGPIRSANVIVPPTDMGATADSEGRLILRSILDGE